MSVIEITQVKSTIGQSEKMKKRLLGLGLKGINQSKVHKDNNCIRGVINKIKHLVVYEIRS